MISYGTKPWEFFRRGWNIFDFLIVALSPIFAGQTVVLRLLRLLRLIRIFRFLPEVKVLTLSIVRSIPPLLSMSVLIFLALFIYGMAGVYLLGDKLPLHWGDISIALTTLFILLTLENFPVYLEEAILVSPLALPFFLSYIFIVVFTVLNVFIGIVLNAMDEARSENREKIEKLKKLDELALEVDKITSDGKVTDQEILVLREKLAALEEMARKK
jgi:voltage-gated sodium channel